MKVAINGFGRIGRAFYRAVYSGQHIDHSTLPIEIVAINDLGERENLEYLLKHDSVYGGSEATLQNVTLLQEKDPTLLPWRALEIDVVVECTGLFTTRELASKHLTAGAKHVVISAPSEDAVTVLMGVNEGDIYKDTITSNASCTTNAVSPLVGILEESIGIEKAMLSTTHAYTATQAIVDGPSRKGMLEGRAAALNIIPSSTGAAKATTKVYTQLKGKFDGISLRVPVPAGSIADLTFIAKRPTTVEEVNTLLRDGAATDRWSSVFAVSDESLVSTDIIGMHHASIADLTLTRVVDGTLVKVMAWYDNEMGYTNALLQHVLAVRR